MVEVKRRVVNDVEGELVGTGAAEEEMTGAGEEATTTASTVG